MAPGRRFSDLAGFASCGRLTSWVLHIIGSSTSTSMASGWMPSLLLDRNIYATVLQGSGGLNMCLAVLDVQYDQHACRDPLLHSTSSGKLRLVRLFGGMRRSFEVAERGNC